MHMPRLAAPSHGRYARHRQVGARGRTWAAAGPPRSDASLVPCPPYWRLISAHGVLHYVYDHEALKDLASQHDIKLFNLEHLLGIAEGNCEDPEHVKGLRLFGRELWLSSVSGKKGERAIAGYAARLVYVYGKAHEWCEAMRLSETDTPFSWTPFRKLLNGTYRSNGKSSKYYTKFSWHAA